MRVLLSMNMPKKAKEDKRVVTVSLCMIVKNEEKILARCLDSIGDLADEIIIVDTGSRDRTKEIAARYTDKIYDCSGKKFCLFKSGM